MNRKIVEIYRKHIEPLTYVEKLCLTAKIAEEPADAATLKREEATAQTD